MMWGSDWLVMGRGVNKEALCHGDWGTFNNVGLGRTKNSLKTGWASLSVVSREAGTFERLKC
jgi:hypothetical protein